MKILIATLVSLFLITAFQAQATVIVAPNSLASMPSDSVNSPGSDAGFVMHSGTKNTRIKKWVARLVLKKMTAYTNGTITERQKRQAKWSMILGLGSIAIVFIPYVGLLSIPAAILAIILGIKSLKGNSNTKGIVGVVAGCTMLLLIIIVVTFFLLTFRFE